MTCFSQSSCQKAADIIILNILKAFLAGDANFKVTVRKNQLCFIYLSKSLKQNSIKKQKSSYCGHFSRVWGNYISQSFKIRIRLDKVQRIIMFNAQLKFTKFKKISGTDWVIVKAKTGLQQKQRKG